jgi:hypothetical protein
LLSSGTKVRRRVVVACGIPDAVVGPFLSSGAGGSCLGCGSGKWRQGAAPRRRGTPRTPPPSLRSGKDRTVGAPCCRWVRGSSAPKRGHSRLGRSLVSTLRSSKYRQSGPRGLWGRRSCTHPHRRHPQGRAPGCGTWWWARTRPSAAGSSYPPMVGSSYCRSCTHCKAMGMGRKHMGCTHSWAAGGTHNLGSHCGTTSCSTLHRGCYTG